MQSVQGAARTSRLRHVLDLDHALTDSGLPRLPSQAEEILRELGVPPRLGAHLRVVHAAACELTQWLELFYPAFVFDRDAVLFGAAVHDVGKTLHPGELKGPGAEHEEDGYLLLLAKGVDARLARFARTHAAWDRLQVQPEDLLVSLADTVWKGKRVADLEDAVIGALARATDSERWEVFSSLDEALQQITEAADDRLAFQARYPVDG